MQTVATFERVKEAYEELLRLGHRPSASRVVAMVGGSKSTVLGHMRAITGDLATGAGAFDPAFDLIESAAGSMARKLWEEATRLSERRFAARLQALVAVQADIFDDLKVAVDAEENARAKLAEAQSRIAVLEAELAEKAEVVKNIDVLKDLMVMLNAPPKVSAMAQMLELLGDGKRHDKQDIYARMRAMGYEAAVVQRARYHAMQAGHIVELEQSGELGVGFKLTAEKKAARA